MENVKKPIAIVFMAAAAVAMLGAALGWFDIANEIIRKVAEGELSKKYTLLFGLSAASVLLVIGAAKANKNRIAFLSTVVTIYQLIMVINQKPDDAIASQIGLSVSMGYYLSIIGTLVMIVASAIIGVKGFSVLADKKFVAAE